MTDSKRAKMLERVRALLAKADSTNFEGEADVFRAKADELMTKFAIEEWQLEATKQGRPEPEARQFNFDWYVASPVKHQLYTMFSSLSKHCRCIVATGTWSNYGSNAIQVVGLPSDLDYFDMLFTHLALQMGKSLEPKPDPDKTMIENLVMMKEAGMKWSRIGELLYSIDQLEQPYTRNTGVKFTKLYSDYCRLNNRPQLRVSPIVYQRSYAQGFVKIVTERIAAMRKAQEDREAGERFMSGDNSMALVLVDIRQQVEDYAYDLLGKKGVKGRQVSRSMTVNGAALGRGREAGKRANISGNPQRGLKSNKQIRR